MEKLWYTLNYDVIFQFFFFDNLYDISVQCFNTHLLIGQDIFKLYCTDFKKYINRRKQRERKNQQAMGLRMPLESEF